MATNTKQNTKVVDDADLDIGDFNLADLAKAGFNETDVMRDLAIIYNAGQPGFEQGKTKLGIYLGTKTAVSSEGKKEFWKPVPGEPGKVYREIHIFQACRPDGEMLNKLFGIWNQGVLGQQLKRIVPNQMVAVTYLGLADKPFKEDQNPHHLFRIDGKNLELRPDLSTLPGQQVQGQASAGAPGMSA